MSVEALTNREEMKPNTSQQKVEMLWREFFPLNDDDKYYQLPPAGSEHTPFRAQAVGLVVFTQSVISAPGLDNLSFGAILLLWKLEKARLVRVTKAAIRTGSHRLVCKQDSRVVPHKPGKDDYRQLKFYRSISVVSYMGKLVKEVVTELQSDEAERRGLMSDGKFGCRRGR